MGIRFGKPHKFPHIFVACFPKSGSTFLSKALQGLASYPEYHLTEEGGNSEQDISRRKLAKARQASVVQQHAKATIANISILREFGIRPIVHVRNLFDVVVALRDHMYNEIPYTPTGHVHREFWQLTQREQFDYLIQIHLPWYFNFLVSWHEIKEEISLISTSYEELFGSPAATLRRLADFYRLDVDDAAIARALHYASHQNTRLNKGVSGRGQQMLTADQRDTVRRLAKVWRVDRNLMHSIGIDLDQLVGEGNPHGEQPGDKTARMAESDSDDSYCPILEHPSVSEKAGKAAGPVRSLRAGAA